MDENAFWKEIEELEMDIGEWNQFLMSLNGEKIIKKGEPVFGELTINQIIDLLRKLSLEFNKYLELAGIGGKEKLKKEIFLEETREVIALWERKIEIL